MSYVLSNPSQASLGTHLPPRRAHPSLALCKPSPPPLGFNAPPVQIENVGWHNRDEIHSFAGLGGSFTWPESPSVFARITFLPTPLVPTPPNFDPGQGGFYAITSNFGGTPIEFGRYHTGLPSFIVPARMRLEPAGFSPPREFLVEGMFTDTFFHTVQFMLIQGVTVPTPVFAAFRTA